MSDEQEGEDDEEDARTLIGSPRSPTFLADETEEGRKQAPPPRRHSHQSSILKGNAKTHMEPVEDEEFLTTKEWGFWEVCAVRTVRRMLASLFLLS